MTLVDPRAGIPYNLSDPFPSAHANSICSQLPFAVDGRGGTYAQTSGLTFTGTQTTTFPKLYSPDAQFISTAHGTTVQHATGTTITYTTTPTTSPVIVCDTMTGDGTISLGVPAFDMQVLVIVNNDPTAILTISPAAGRTMDPGSCVIGRLSPYGNTGVTVQANGTSWRVVARHGRELVRPAVSMAQGGTLVIDSTFRYSAAIYAGAKTADCAVQLGEGYSGQLVRIMSSATPTSWGANVTTTGAGALGYLGPAKVSAAGTKGITLMFDGVADASNTRSWRCVGAY